MARPIPVQGQQLWCVVTRRGPLDQLCKTNIRATLIMLTTRVKQKEETEKEGGRERQRERKGDPLYVLGGTLDLPQRTL